jgi:acyl phosphate:glycerol-3-phosphate acyltransferase
MIMTDIITTTAGVFAGYLLGSIPTAVWWGKAFYGVDVRNEGSGNAGATNTIRVLGVKAGIPVLLFDVFKGWLAVFLSAFLIGAEISPVHADLFRILVAAAAVLGHVFPVFAGFRGGKGIATLLGVGFALFQDAALFTLGLFILMLIITRYVSVSSITAAITFPFTVFFLFNPDSLPLMVLAVFVGILVPFTHRQNIRRLLKSEESKFSFKKKKTS